MGACPHEEAHRNWRGLTDSERAEMAEHKAYWVWQYGLMLIEDEQSRAVYWGA